MSLEEIDVSMAKDIVASEPRGVLVDFWSPWCAPCRVLKPHLRNLSEERKALWRFVAVNTEANPEAAEAYSVQSLPTIILFRGGTEIHRFAGSALVSSIAEKLDELTQ